MSAISTVFGNYLLHVIFPLLLPSTTLIPIFFIDAVQILQYLFCRGCHGRGGFGLKLDSQTTSPALPGALLYRHNLQTPPNITPAPSGYLPSGLRNMQNEWDSIYENCQHWRYASRCHRILWCEYAVVLHVTIRV